MRSFERPFWLAYVRCAHRGQYLLTVPLYLLCLSTQGVPIGSLLESMNPSRGLRRDMAAPLLSLEAAVSKGAEVLAGGSRHHDNFVTPTVLTGVTEGRPSGPWLA